MNRRAYLATIGGLGLFSSAGCLGNSDETEDLERDLANLEDEVDHLESRESELENQVRDLEEDSVEYDKFVKERLETLYEIAASYHTLAEEEYDLALNYTEDREWAAAARYFGIAFRSYDVTTEYTFQAESIAVDEGYTAAQEVAYESNSYVDGMADACDHYGLGAEYLAIGEDSSADQEFNQGDSFFEEAQQFDFRSQREFEAVL